MFVKINVTILESIVNDTNIREKEKMKKSTNFLNNLKKKY